MITTIILTFNEENNITECIKTLRTWCQDIVVYDSFSTDKTVELAKLAGARVFQRKFDNYASQRNAAISEVPLKNDWILMADADERWGEEIGVQMLEIVKEKGNEDISIFHFKRKDIFLGTWLKHGIGANTWFGRLMKYRDVRILRDINEEYHCSGKKEYISGCRFLHYPFSNGINRWISKHNNYSDMESIRLSAEKNDPLVLSCLFHRDPVIRRKHQKQFLYRLPGRPWLMFLVLYFFKCGFLDGKAGFHYAMLRSFYEYMIDLKISEKKQCCQSADR